MKFINIVTELLNILFIALIFMVYVTDIKVAFQGNKEKITALSVELLIIIPLKNSEMLNFSAGKVVP